MVFFKKSDVQFILSLQTSLYLFRLSALRLSIAESVQVGMSPDTMWSKNAEKSVFMTEVTMSSDAFSIGK